MTYRVYQNSAGIFVVERSDGKVMRMCETNAEAWRAVDRLENEPINRQEELGDWISRKILNSWPQA